MRVAAEPALCAVRSIAQISWRIDMALRDPRSATKVTKLGKVCVNRVKMPRF
jgi:hypothetical protein